MNKLDFQENQNSQENQDMANVKATLLQQTGVPEMSENLASKIIACAENTKQCKPNLATRVLIQFKKFKLSSMVKQPVLASICFFVCTFLLGLILGLSNSVSLHNSKSQLATYDSDSEFLIDIDSNNDTWEVL